MTAWCRHCDSMFRVDVAYGSVPAFCPACLVKPGLPTVPVTPVKAPKSKRRRKSLGTHKVR